MEPKGEKAKECHNPQRSAGGMLISRSDVIELVLAYTTESITHGRFDIRPTFTFPDAEQNTDIAP